MSRSGVHLGGRAAERLHLGNVSAGAGGGAASDLAQATRLVLDFDRKMGLGRLGNGWLGEANLNLLSQPERDRVRVKLDLAEAQARKILEAHRSLLEDMAASLVDLREFDADTARSWLQAVVRDAAAERSSAGSASNDRPPSAP